MDVVFFNVMFVALRPCETVEGEFYRAVVATTYPAIGPAAVHLRGFYSVFNSVEEIYEDWGIGFGFLGWEGQEATFGGRLFEIET
jgi:hypothetical protein